MSNKSCIPLLFYTFLKITTSKQIRVYGFGTIVIDHVTSYFLYRVELTVYLARQTGLLDRSSKVGLRASVMFQNWKQEDRR